MRFPRALSVATGLALLVTAGCARTADPGPGITRSFNANDLVLRIDLVDGFVPPMARVTQLPIVSVYGDGRVITQGPVPAIYPGPALPNLQLQHINGADVRRLADLAVTAGVGRSGDLGQPQVADAPSTRFAVLTDTGLATTQVNALDITEFDDRLSAAQRAGRAALRGFVDDASNLSTTLGAAAIDEPQPYIAITLAVVATAWTDPEAAGIPAPAPLAWPGPALPGPPLPSGFDLSCLTVTDTATTAVLTAAAHANTVTPWTSGGSRWTVAIRPLLPDEADCADLTH